TRLNVCQKHFPVKKRVPYPWAWPPFYKERFKRALTALLNNLGDDAGADGAAALANREAAAVFERDGHNQLDFHLNVVTGHDHLNPFGQFDRAGHVHRAHVELRPIAVEE